MLGGGKYTYAAADDDDDAGVLPKRFQSRRPNTSSRRLKEGEHDGATLLHYKLLVISVEI